MAPLTLCELCGLGSILFRKHFTDCCWCVGGYHGARVEVRGQLSRVSAINPDLG